ncbi:Uncharacterized protein conserved in bacteria [Mycolicibacterium thermoresistibile]|uniref:DUF779 domain-containing protein n=1 Tax=Mycolicibacterium thermoresistibile TaxID=1797 RepID=A0A117IMR4_MYCTH|nr:DUF779 domain-containing protein [Mycolicibacterium thermoresistibile]GAT15698.1 hypothetical protein RMCT_2668 [Mycolicibacterium thermoresistibile]SNW16753.1 Uncharacterized protein conserved in bacteria [Mycolicibacterium thermoresistibile]
MGPDGDFGVETFAQRPRARRNREEKEVPPPRVDITGAAAELVRRLRARHGPLMFHQSGGCCDGSLPMCFPEGEFLVGDRDVLLGVVEQTPVWISGPQFDAWRHTQLIIDVVPGRGAGFSLEAPEGVRFLTRGRAFDEREIRLLADRRVLTGADCAGAGRTPGVER